MGYNPLGVERQKSNYEHVKIIRNYGRKESNSPQWLKGNVRGCYMRLAKEAT